MKIKIYFLILIPTIFSFLNSNAESSNTQIKATTKNEIEQQIVSLCNEYKSHYGKDKVEEFFKKIKKEILFFENKRAVFGQGLVQKKITGCETALSDYINKSLSSQNYEPKPGEQAFLSMALMAKIPAAYKVIEKEIDKGLLSSWIDKLKETNENAYYDALQSWISKVAQEVRTLSKDTNLDDSNYGKLTKENNELKSPNAVRIWTPILMNRYLTETIQKQKKLHQNEFSHLNIIYAASTSSYKEIFGEQISKIISYNSKEWVLSFRKERPWIQFRLFPLLQQSNDGNITREIIWISNNHENKKLRELALSTLEKLAEKRSRNY